MEYIVKYDNRKLYSKSLNKYVNLDYLIDLVIKYAKNNLLPHKPNEQNNRTVNHIFYCIMECLRK